MDYTTVIPIPGDHINTVDNKPSIGVKVFLCFNHHEVGSPKIVENHQSGNQGNQSIGFRLVHTIYIILETRDYDTG